MFVVTYRKVFYIISALLVVGSLIAIATFGLRYGIDFKGGAILEVKYNQPRPEKAAIEAGLAPLELGASVRPTGDNGYIIRMRSLTQVERETVLRTVGGQEVRFDSIGPVLGQEAARHAYVSIALVIIAILFFIAFAFRRVSKPISSWKYGIIAIISLVHDVIIPAGAFAILGHYAGYEVDTLFVTALLVVLGFSIHDTIVVFDRVRENLGVRGDKEVRGEEFEKLVGNSISQTLARSINTSLTTILALVALYIFGGEATRQFSLALIIGMIAGTYSSIFLGSPLLVTFEKWQARKGKK